MTVAFFIKLDESDLEKFIQELTENRPQKTNFDPNEMKRYGLAPVLLESNCNEIFR